MTQFVVNNWKGRRSLSLKTVDGQNELLAYPFN